MRSFTVWAYLSLAFAIAGVCQADDDPQAFFESKIRPVLVSKCYECHSESSKEPKGGLLLDTREGIRRGGDSGHAVVPKDVEESLILGALRYDSFEMPPDEPLPDNVIADFEKWIELGAADPRDGKSAPIRREIDFERARDFWSYQPIADPPVPQVKRARWGRTAIDAFLLSAMEAKSLVPVSDADALTLVRRVYFDLIGMQPSPGEAAAFQAAYADDAELAMTQLVDRLLDSRHFGERWGRHWLDVVRYAESTGMERNGTFPHAWRYRDWVIQAFNDDRPYDQFATQQIAGDLLPYDDIRQRRDNLVATGLLALGPKSLNEPNAEKFEMDVVDDQIDVVTRSFLGLTASCARCHDHKFDPIPQTEYYALAGIFTSTQTLYGTAKTNGNRRPGGLLAIDGDQVKTVTEIGGKQTAKERKRYESQLKAAQRKLTNFRDQLAGSKNEQARKAAQKRIEAAQEEVRKWKSRLKQVAEPESQIGKTAQLVMGVRDASSAEDTRLRIRGEPNERGSPVPRGFLTIASLAETPDIPASCSGRLELAQWITQRSNPLASRVMVNRVWQHLFGRGIVPTVNNFGANGDRPTHPLLLDYLATSFVQDGWSVKRLIRQIMLSRAYRLSSAETQQGLAIDPGNQLYWRMNQRRLEAEAIRDAMLVASGGIDLGPADTSVIAKVGDGIVGQSVKTDQLFVESRERSVYLPIVRGAVPEILQIFDFPEPSIIAGVRDVTTVPTQALFMMNNPFVSQAAADFARRLVEQEQQDAAERVRLAYRLAVIREPSASEVAAVLAYIQDVQRELKQGDDRSAEQARTDAWASFCQSLFAASEFRYIN